MYHPDFGGSFSIKRVLPALVPALSYGDLEIQEGELASVELQRLLFQGDAMRCSSASAASWAASWGCSRLA